MLSVKPLARDDEIQRARLQAEAAADRAKVAIRPLEGVPEMEATAAFLKEVWSAPDSSAPISTDVLAALRLSGNYVVGAFASSGEMVGATVAWASVAPEPELHSHVTGVSTTKQHAGVGRALKLDQRAWALEHGIDVVSWTFDPLVRKNAAFNLRRLGAMAEEYLENVYGEMEDLLNKGDESDRLFLRWHLLDPRVFAAAEGMPAEPTSSGKGEILKVPTPEDIVEIRRSQTGESRSWRARLRAELGAPMRSGWRLLGIDEEGDYILEKGVVEA